MENVLPTHRSICDGSTANAVFEHEAITTGNVDVEVLENYF